MVIYKIDQRWVKNNRDPINIVFGIAGVEHDKFAYDDTAFLLTMALLDKALYGYETLADLRMQKILAGENELALRFHESALDLPILRKVAKDYSLTNEPMSRTIFVNLVRKALSSAG